MIVTMDGPAGAGKSVLAKLLAERLGYSFLDTGAMYRCATLACLRRGIDFTDVEAVEQCGSSILIEYRDNRIILDGDDVTDHIRTNHVTQAIRPVADNQLLRKRMVELQRNWAQGRDVVTEGRDQGTVAFPEAICKIFLTASSEERARRRAAQLELQGVKADYDQILAMQNERDRVDTARVIGGLKAADDAIFVYTDGLTEDQVLERLVEIVQARRGLDFVDVNSDSVEQSESRQSNQRNSCSASD